MKLGIIFNLPFRLIEEDIFEFPVKRTVVKVMIKHKQNLEGAEKIMGVKIESSGRGAKADMNPDHHGIISYSSIKMEISDKSDFTFQSIINQSTFDFDIIIKKKCVEYLNRLVKVVRYTTNNFWIHYVNLRDIMNFQVFDLSTNPPMACISFNPNDGYYYPNINSSDQSSVRTDIDDILKTQANIPIWKNIFLDSINYFTMGRFNESVITVNIALESFVATHLYNKLNEQILGNEQENRKKVIRLPKSLHEIMKKHFPKIDGRDFENDSKLWKKFDDIRVYIRTRAMHSFTMELDEKTSFNTLNDIKEIIKWIDSSVNI